jgi:hypothetical protein
MTAAEAFASLRARLEDAGSGITIPLHWQAEAAVLPDTPAAFAYVEFVASGGAIASYGGGRGSNRYRHRARVEAYVFTPNGAGLESALTHAETIAARLRSYRDNDLSCFSAVVHPGGHGSQASPPGLSRNALNDYWYAVVEVEMTYDQIG